MLTKYRTPHTSAHPFGGFFGRDISQLFGHDDLTQLTPRVNITETPEKFVVSLRVPGFAKEELKVSAEQDILTVKGEKSSSSSTENERFLRREFQASSFSRSFQLPEAVRIEAITAEHVNGVLNLSIPKSEPAKPQTREINIA